jgi:hypothetical protein
MKHGVNGALGGNADVAVQTPNQELPNLVCTPMRSIALASNNQGLDPGRQLVGIAPRAVAQGDRDL